MSTFSSMLKAKHSICQIETIDEIFDQYQTYLIDLWGVVYDGISPFPSAIDAINRLLTSKKNVVFLTNMPRSKDLVFSKMKEFNVLEGFDVVTSGDVTETYIKEHFPNGVMYHFGKENNQEIAKTVPETENLDEADFVLLSLFIDDMSLLDENIRLCKAIAQSKKPVLCANPDKQAFFGDQIRLTGGYFANIIEENGGHVHYIGKPFIDVYNKALSIFKSEPSTSIMIGDTLETDILGAYNAGIDSMLTLSGVTQSELLKENISLEAFIDKNNILPPTYTISKLQ